MKFTAVGDAIIGRRIQEDFEGYAELAPFIRQGDARFFNLETTLNEEGECFASALSGGTYLRTAPAVLEDLRKFGFNMTSFNNNHAMDYSYDGLLRTFEAVKDSGLVQAGVGYNLAQASAPQYLDTPNGRVALIAFNTTFNPSMMAGVQTERIKGRPGINGLRVSHMAVVSPEEFAYIKDLAKRTGINAEREIERKEGYFLDNGDNVCEFGEELFTVGEPTGVRYTVNKADMARLEKAIDEAKLQADYILISIHSHEIVGEAKETPTEYIRELAHHCIDIGAHAIIGHGPHLLRPIEVYKDCPIFYSLGDFVLQLYNVAFAPEEMYRAYGLPHNATVHELLKTRSHDFTIGLMTDRRMFETVIPCWEMADGKMTKLTLMPVTLSMDGNKSQIGLPRHDRYPAFVARLAAMCKPYGVEMTLTEDGLLECAW